MKKTNLVIFAVAGTGIILFQANYHQGYLSDLGVSLMIASGFYLLLRIAQNSEKS